MICYSQLVLGWWILAEGSCDNALWTFIAAAAAAVAVLLLLILHRAKSTCTAHSNVNRLGCPLALWASDVTHLRLPTACSSTVPSRGNTPRINMPCVSRTLPTALAHVTCMTQNVYALLQVLHRGSWPVPAVAACAIRPCEWHLPQVSGTACGCRDATCSASSTAMCMHSKQHYTGSQVVTKAAYQCKALIMHATCRWHLLCPRVLEIKLRASRFHPTALCVHRM
jgi:hypothetical protein